MSLHDFQCCQGISHPTDECRSCPLAPRVPSAREVDLGYTHESARVAFDDLAKRALIEGAHSALALVEIGLERGLSVEAAIEVARQGTDVWAQP